MAKLNLNAIQGGLGSANLLNSNFQEIALAFENTLSRDGDTPNAMSADLDMNSNDILNCLNVYVDNGTTTLFQQVNASTLALRDEMQTISDNFTTFTISTLAPTGGVDGDLWYKY